MSRRFILNLTVRECSILDWKRAKQEKSPWVKIKKKKTGDKEHEQGQSLNVQRKHTQKKLQLTASGKGLWFNQAVVVSKASSSKDIGATRTKITASAAGQFIDESQRRRDDPAIFAVFDRLKN